MHACLVSILHVLLSQKLAKKITFLSNIIYYTTIFKAISKLCLHRLKTLNLRLAQTLNFPFKFTQNSQILTVSRYNIYILWLALMKRRRRWRARKWEYGVTSYQCKLIKMRAKLASLNDCAAPFLSRAPSTCAGTIHAFNKTNNVQYRCYQASTTPSLRLKC